VTVDALNSKFSSIDGVLFDNIQSTLIFFPKNKSSNYNIPNSVTSIGDFAFYGCRFTDVTIPTGVTNIGSSAFQSSMSLVSAKIPNSVTSIGNNAFYNCYNLISTTIPDSVISIGNSAFQYCPNMTRVTIGSGVTSIGNTAFDQCNSLINIFFRGNAPVAGNAVFSGGTIYYLVGAKNYGATYAGRPTAQYLNPTITTQPVNVTVNQGAIATLTVAATGTLPAYQWQKNGMDIAGATSATFVLNNAQTSDAGSFTVIVSNGGSVTSNAAVLTVNVPITIITQPVSVTTNLGTSASLSVAATGGSPTYQWKKAGVNIVGATEATLSFGTLLSTDAGSYTVVVTNAAGSVTSSAATLTVISPPTISTQPLSVAANLGASASLSVVAIGGTPYIYQWQKGGSDVAGATAATLNLSNVQTSDAASYTVTVTNAAGSVTSNAAVLTVIVPPSITVQPVSVTANLGASASFSVTATGTSPTYQWKKAGVNITGATSAMLSFGTLLATDSGSYTVTATNAAGTLTSSTVTLTVISPPTISTQPVSISPNLGASASLSVTATGGAPYTYQWQKGGTDVTGATAATLSFATLSSTDAGSYTVVVINAAGSVTSNAAILTVVMTPTIAVQPVSINANQGASATFSVTAAGGGTYTYQWKKAGVNIVGATTATLSLSNVQSADAVTYSVTVTNAMGNVTSNAATLTVVVPPVIIDQPTNITANPGEAAVFSVVAAGSPSTYLWMRNGVTLAGATQADLNFSMVQPVHVGSYRVVVSNAAGSVTSFTVSLTLTQGALYTQAQYDSGLQAGLNAGLAVGMATGRTQVTDFPNNYGLYNLSQVQALNVGTPLLAKDSATGKFKLTIGVEKSTNLVNFSPMAIPVGAATINAQGKMEFQFTSPDNAAFFRIESR
jgi:uncharacterized repeat protein (TIGR01451 family)